MNIRKAFKYVASRPEFAALTIFIIIAITFYIINENFLNFRNLRVLLTISPEIALIAMGATILMAKVLIGFDASSDTERIWAE